MNKGIHAGGLLATVLCAFLLSSGTARASVGGPGRNITDIRCRNGLVLLVERVPDAKVVNFGLLIRTGSSTEASYAGTGITHLLEHLIFKGTGETALASVVENAGGYTNAHTSRDETYFTVTVPKETWQDVLPCLLRSVFRPSFSQADFDSERKVVLRELARREDSPETLAAETLWATAFLVHPYRFPVGGDPARLAGIAYEDVKAYHADCYTPANAILAVAGDIRAEEISDACEKETTGSGRPAWNPVQPAEPAQICARETTVPFHTRLAYLYTGFHIPPLADARTPTLDLLASVMGDGRTSRLFKALVEKRIAHSCACYSYTLRFSGMFTVAAVCSPERVAEVRDVVRSEIDRVCRRGVSKSELSRAVRALSGAFLFSRETVESRAADLGENYFLTGNARYSEEYLSSLRRVTVSDLRDVARTFLRPEQATIVLVAGPADPGGPITQTSSATKDSRETEIGVVRRVLSNGIPLLTLEKSDLPIVSMSAFLKGGRLFENADNAGLFSLMAGLMTEGTRGRSGERIARSVASWGGSLNAHSGNNSFGVTLSVPSESWKAGLALLADIVRTPSFPSTELDRRKSQAKAAIIAREEDSFARAESILREKIYGSHPYGLPEGGTLESVGRCTVDNLKTVHRDSLGRENLVLSVFGNADARQVAKEAERLLSGIGKSGLDPVPVFSVENVHSAVVNETMKRKEATVAIGFPGITVSDGRRAHLEVFSHVLNNQDGLLFQRLREKEPLVYATGFSYFLGLQPGMLVFYAQGSSEKADRIRDAMQEVIASLSDAPLAADVVEKVKRKVTGMARIRLQSLSSQAFEAGLSELYGLGYDFQTRLEDSIRKVTASDLQRVARELFRPDRQVTVMIKPES